MKELSKKISEQLSKIDAGQLSVEDLEALVKDAQELYERLIILKFKAYEKYGAPTKEPIKEEAPVVAKEEKIETLPPVVEEAIIDFSAMEEIPEVEELEPPLFDFSASEEVEATKPKVEAAPKEKVKLESAKEDDEDEDGVDQNTLHQKLGVDDELSLRKKLQSTPVKDLKSEISIAKKFEYITFMFEGNNQSYEEAMQVLNSCTDGEDAKNKLNEYSTKYNWDLENKSIIKFVELVERRYL